MARLKITTPQGAETLDLLGSIVITVGRDPSNRVALPEDHQASRRHCRIGPREGGVAGWEVVDLGSTNKTRVNGHAITR
ncbi:MAG: FHA domain-containing protein, partial [Planctomycetota bacterium]